MNSLLKSISVLAIVCSVYFQENQVFANGPPIQILYNSTNPELQQHLPLAKLDSIIDAQGTFFIRISGTSYSISVLPMNWYKAYQMCRLKGGFLFAKKYADINSYLVKMRAPPAIKYWSAASCLSMNNTFRWASTGLDLTQSEMKWAPGHPKSQSIACVYIERSGKEYLMKTDFCTSKHYALCEIEQAHSHNHKSNNKRNKRKTVRMHSIFVN